MVLVDPVDLYYPGYLSHPGCLEDLEVQKVLEYLADPLDLGYPEDQKQDLR